jgi:hypothetical protein
MEIQTSFRVVGIPANNKGCGTSSAIVGKDANNPRKYVSVKPNFLIA